MSFGNWRTIAAFGTLAAYILGALFWIVWDVSSGLTEQRVRREESAKQHTDYAADRIERACVNREGSALAECVHVEIQAANDHYRAERDLDAQEAMALWAKLMTVVSGAGLAATALGLYFVWRTLQASESATKAAIAAVEVTREIGIIQTRANLTYSGFRVTDVTSQGVRDSAGILQETRIDIIFRNSGHTPARDVLVDVMNRPDLIWGARRPDGQYSAPTFREFDEAKIRGQTRRFCGAESEFSPHHLYCNKAELTAQMWSRKFPYIAGWVRYRDDFWKTEADYRYCKFCLLIDAPLGQLRLRSLPASKETLSMAEHGPDNYST